jgi:hypothetical protein
MAGDSLADEIKKRLNKERSASKPKAPAPAPSANPITWKDFLAAHQAKGLERAEIEKRFRLADRNHDEVLTPEEMEAHRIEAARNKSKKKRSS